MDKKGASSWEGCAYYFSTHGRLSDESFAVLVSIAGQARNCEGPFQTHKRSNAVPFAASNTAFSETLWKWQFVSGEGENRLRGAGESAPGSGGKCS
jgi:hypothetical protein